jgi:hypothetical protein
MHQMVNREHPGFRLRQTVLTGYDGREKEHPGAKSPGPAFSSITTTRTGARPAWSSHSSSNSVRLDLPIRGQSLRQRGLLDLATQRRSAPLCGGTGFNSAGDFVPKRSAAPTSQGRMRRSRKPLSVIGGSRVQIPPPPLKQTVRRETARCVSLRWSWRPRRPGQRSPSASAGIHRFAWRLANRWRTR